MNPHFTMLHETALAAMHKLDRILDRDNVIVPVQIGVIHHRRERGRFAGAGRTSHKDQSLLEKRKLFQNGGQAEVVDGQYFRWDQAKHRRNAILLLKKIGPITSHSGHFVTEIDVGSFLENFYLTLRGNLVDHRFEIVVLQRWIIDPNQVAVNAEHWRVVRREVKIRGLLLGHELEKCVDASHGGVASFKAKTMPAAAVSQTVSRRCPCR